MFSSFSFLFSLTSCIHKFFFFFLNDPATPEISPLPLHAALPISGSSSPGPTAATRRTPSAPPTRPRPTRRRSSRPPARPAVAGPLRQTLRLGDDCVTALLDCRDRKSTRLNSSH